MKPNKFLTGRSGIYGIRNIINNKIYVGRTTCMYRRCHQHVRCVINNNTDGMNIYLMNAIKKAGIENFEMFPLEFCDDQVSPDREMHWMITLRSTERNFGYNLRTDVCGGMVPHDETRAKISATLKRQWAKGERSHHPEKMKANWAANPQRRARQSDILRGIRTKFEYEVHHPDGVIERCDYRRLKELGLQNSISNFHRSGANETTCKKFKIIRHSRGENG